jgi:nucleotide-binding universal stress UspA family protein
MFNHLLLAIDESEQSQRALAVARDLATATKGDVQVVHVREAVSEGRSGPIWHEGSQNATSIVDAAVAELKTAGVEATGSVRDSIRGVTAQEINDAAHEAQASLIIMGNRGHSQLTDILIGSVVHDVLSHGTLPVLVVR